MYSTCKVCFNEKVRCEFCKVCGVLQGALRGVSVEENVEDLETYRGCCVVFDDMLDSNQKLIDPIFTRGRHKFCNVCYLSQSNFDVPKKQIETIRR